MVLIVRWKDCYRYIAGLFRMWRMELLIEKWPNINEEVADKEILMYINKAQVMDLGSYLDKVRYRRLVKQNDFKQFLM